MIGTRFKSDPRLHSIYTKAKNEKHTRISLKKPAFRMRRNEDFFNT